MGAGIRNSAEKLELVCISTWVYLYELELLDLHRINRLAPGASGVGVALTSRAPERSWCVKLVEAARDR